MATREETDQYWQYYNAEYRRVRRILWRDRQLWVREVGALAVWLLGRVVLPGALLWAPALLVWLLLASAHCDVVALLRDMQTGLGGATPAELAAGGRTLAHLYGVLTLLCCGGLLATRPRTSLFQQHLHAHMAAWQTRHRAAPGRCEDVPGGR